LAVSQTHKSKGYLATRIVPKRSLDERSKLVAYSVEIDESKQFHMGQVFFEGLPAETAAALAKLWRLKPGDLFDPAYASQLIETTAAQVLLPRGLKQVNTLVRQDPDLAAARVNLHIKFQ
jgi:outer membrane protein assembly factor BamA